MKKVYILALALTIIISFIPSPFNESFNSEYLSTSSGYQSYSKLGPWYLIPGTATYSTPLEKFGSFPCFFKFEYFGLPFPSARDVCVHVEFSPINFISNFAIYLALVFIFFYIKEQLSGSKPKSGI